MIFEKVFLEKHLKDHPRVNSILTNLNVSNADVHLLDRYDDVFQKVRKPYLHKRESLNLFLAQKKGSLVKPAPDAYGLAGSPHYYFIHAMNCLYECQYCYLQGYFKSPDLVFFVNHEEIGEEIRRLTEVEHKNEAEVWFHGGEFSDSLALAHLGDEWSYYWKLFRDLPRGRLELRTKSSNTKPIEKLEPLSNVLITFSLSPEDSTKEIDLKTPPLEIRLKAIERLYKLGHHIGLHFDPMMWRHDFEEAYDKLMDKIENCIPLREIKILSLGVVRFPENIYHEVKKNYPDSLLKDEEWVKGFDGKIRYPRPIRERMLKKIKTLCIKKGMSENQLYFCMEDPSLEG
jgi:spore photoproduct lyase